MNPKKYYGSLDSGIKRDDLLSMSDQVPVFIRNIEIATDTTVHRGDLMAATDPQGTYHLAGAADSAANDRFYCIIVDDYEADAEHYICQGYLSGIFHLEKIKVAEGAKIQDFELRLREQGIWLRKLLDRYNHWNFFDEP